MDESKGRWQHAADKINAEKAVIEAIKEGRERKRKAKRAKKYCIKMMKFFASTAGLLVINIAYMFAGAYIFSHLEKLNELEGCRNAASDYAKAENATLILLMDMAQRMDGIGDYTADELGDVRNDFKEYLQSFALSVLDTGHDINIDCEMLGVKGYEHEFDWSIQGSLVFALTVVTTIGYGHISPATRWGRLVCIAYAIIGLPLFMLCLANVGEVLANLFKLIYSSICCCGCCRKKQEKEKSDEENEKEMEQIQKVAQTWRLDPDTGRPIPPEEGMEEEEEEEEQDEEEEEEEELTVPLTISLGVLLGFIFIGTGLFMFFEEYTFTDSTYYSFTTISTIGFGDLVPDTSLNSGFGVVKSMVVVLYITIGMAALSMCLQMLSDETVAKFQWIGEKLGMNKTDENAENAEKAEITSLTDASEA